MLRGERERGREGEREGEIIDMKKAPLLRRAALKMCIVVSNDKPVKQSIIVHYSYRNSNTKENVYSCLG